MGVGWWDFLPRELLLLRIFRETIEDGVLTAFQSTSGISLGSFLELLSMYLRSLHVPS